MNIQKLFLTPTADDNETNEKTTETCEQKMEIVQY